MDQITLERARRGDRDAQASLLSASQDMWFRFCLSQLGSADMARDATQETALRVLRQLPGFRGESRIETWSLGIALNVVREFRRDAGRQAVLRLADGVNPREFAEAGDAPGGDELDKMHRLLRELPERQRQAIVLRFFEQLSVEETAAAMSCAVGTVKATVHQALRTLRQRMDKRPM